MEFTRKEKAQIRHAIKRLNEYYLGELTRIDWLGARFTTRAGDGSQRRYWFCYYDEQSKITIQTQQFGEAMTISV